MARLPKSKSRRPRRNLPAAGALHHAVPLQNHQKTVRGAFVQLQGRGNLRQSQRSIALTQQIQNGKSPVQGLNLYKCLAGLRLASWSSIPFYNVSLSFCRNHYRVSSIGTPLLLVI